MRAVAIEPFDRNASFLRAKDRVEPNAVSTGELHGEGRAVQPAANIHVDQNGSIRDVGARAHYRSTISGLERTVAAAEKEVQVAERQATASQQAREEAEAKQCQLEAEIQRLKQRAAAQQPIGVVEIRDVASTANAAMDSVILWARRDEEVRHTLGNLRLIIGRDASASE